MLPINPATDPFSDSFPLDPRSLGSWFHLRTGREVGAELQDAYLELYLSFVEAGMDDFAAHETALDLILPADVSALEEALP